MLRPGLPLLVSIFALAVGLAPARVTVAAPAAPKSLQLDGKVVPLAPLLEKVGSKLDPEAAPHWLALVPDDGKVYPLVKDSGSRLFFSDPRLLNRPMRVTGRLFQDT